MFKMEFELGNAYFVEGREHSVSETLKAIAEKVEDGNTKGFIYDGNGNTVGEWECEYAEMEEPDPEDTSWNDWGSEGREVWSHQYEEWFLYNDVIWDKEKGDYIPR